MSKPKRRQNIPIKAIIFDMDGVLVDTSPCHSAAYDLLWKSLSIKGPQYKTIAGRSTKEVIAQYGEHLNEQQQIDAVSFKQSSALKFLKTANISFADTHDSLVQLYNAKIPMIVATSASRASAELALGNAGLTMFFSQVITSADVDKSKPAPDLFVAAIQSLGVMPEESLVLEDSQSGITAALASGAYTVAVRESDTLDEKSVNHSHCLLYTSPSPRDRG